MRQIFGLAVGERVASHQADYGIAVCGTGMGISIAANKVPKIRAAVAHDVNTARLAREHGVDGILVSNHGGRATETGRSTIEALSEVVDGAGDQMTVMVDGGFRRGTDVYKALALGARAVGIGRPYVWALSALGQEGVERVLDRSEQHRIFLDHPRSGELVAIARPDAWFTYYYWLDDARAPDFARLVEIHRKPGYDPVELFLDPGLKFPKIAIAWRLAKRTLGLRTLMDVIPLEANLVKGSHGRPTDNEADGPLFISSEPRLVPDAIVPATDVKPLILGHVFD